MDLVVATVRKGPRAMWQRALRLLSALRLSAVVNSILGRGSGFGGGGVTWEWPPSPATIRRCAPALFAVLFVPKFALDIRRLFSAVKPDRQKVRTNMATPCVSFVCGNQ